MSVKAFLRLRKEREVGRGREEKRKGIGRPFRVRGNETTALDLAGLQLNESRRNE